MSEESKVCKRCQQILPITDFWKKGRLRVCKYCEKSRKSKERQKIQQKKQENNERYYNIHFPVGAERLFTREDLKANPRQIGQPLYVVKLSYGGYRTRPK